MAGVVPARQHLCQRRCLRIDSRSQTTVRLGPGRLSSSGRTTASAFVAIKSKAGHRAHERRSTSSRLRCSAKDRAVGHRCSHALRARQRPCHRLREQPSCGLADLLASPPQHLHKDFQPGLVLAGLVRLFFHEYAAELSFQIRHGLCKCESVHRLAVGSPLGDTQNVRVAHNVAQAGKLLAHSCYVVLPLQPVHTTRIVLRTQLLQQLGSRRHARSSFWYENGSTGGA